MKEKKCKTWWICEKGDLTRETDFSGKSCNCPFLRSASLRIDGMRTPSGDVQAGSAPKIPRVPLQAGLAARLALGYGWILPSLEGKREKKNRIWRLCVCLVKAPWLTTRLEDGKWGGQRWVAWLPRYRSPWCVHVVEWLRKGDSLWW